MHSSNSSPSHTSLITVVKRAKTLNLIYTAGDGSDSGDSVWGTVTSSHGMSIAIIIAVAILVGVVILTVGLLCLKW